MAVSVCGYEMKAMISDHTNAKHFRPLTSWFTCFFLLLIFVWYMECECVNVWMYECVNVCVCVCWVTCRCDYPLLLLSWPGSGILRNICSLTHKTHAQWSLQYYCACGFVCLCVCVRAVSDWALNSSFPLRLSRSFSCVHCRVFDSSEIWCVPSNAVRHTCWCMAYTHKHTRTHTHKAKCAWMNSNIASPKSLRRSILTVIRGWRDLILDGAAAAVSSASTCVPCICVCVL